MTANAKIVCKPEELTGHPIDAVSELLHRIGSCADLLETVTDSLQPELKYSAQYYTVIGTIRALIEAADDQVKRVCDEQNRLEAEARRARSENA